MQQWQRMKIRLKCSCQILVHFQHCYFSLFLIHFFLPCQLFFLSFSHPFPQQQIFCLKYQKQLAEMHFLNFFIRFRNYRKHNCKETNFYILFLRCRHNSRGSRYTVVYSHTKRMTWEAYTSERAPPVLKTPFPL